MTDLGAVSTPVPTPWRLTTTSLFERPRLLGEVAACWWRGAAEADGSHPADPSADLQGWGPPGQSWAHLLIQKNDYNG